jgi:type II secretory pathway component GspD/PulD (secretin)
LKHPGNSVAKAAATSGSEPDGSFAEGLTPEEFPVFLKALEQRDGTDLLTEASVTTLSGRQAQIQVADIKTIVSKINPQALVAPGVSSSNLLTTENLSFGPVLDVVPTLGDDGTTVSLDVTATLTEFLGYDPSARGEKVRVYVDGKAESTKPPHPRMRVRQLHQVAIVTDGQTLMLGRPTDMTTHVDKNGKEIGGLTTEKKKDLLVFLTTTLIDSAGNPIHSPFAPSQK